jgi:hypothetical protein
LKLRLALSFALTVLAGCECGPGVPCKTNAECGTWGHCDATTGYCLAGNAGEPPKIIVNVDKLDFPDVPCGTRVTLPIQIFNAGGGQLTFTTSVSNPYFSVAEGASVDGGSNTTLGVSAMVPSTTMAGADPSGMLTVTSNDPSKSKVEIPLSLKASGVTLTLQSSIVPFGAYPLNMAAADNDIVLTNNGNVPATVMFGQPLDAQFSLSWAGKPAPITIDPGKTASMLKAGFTPRRVMPTMTTAAISVAEAVCGMSATSIQLTGGGTGGELTLSPADVIFGAAGKVDCGATASAKTVTVQNTGNAVLNWTAALGKAPASPFTIAQADGGALAGKLSPMQSTDLLITPAAIPAVASTATDGFGDTLTFQTDVANDTPHPLGLHQTASGAVLSFVPGSVDFGLVPLNTTASAPFSIVNGGNSAATVSLVSSSDKFKLTSAATLWADGGSTNPLTALFTPDAGFLPDGGVLREDGTLSMTAGAGDVLCAPLPGALALTGVGTTGSVSYTPAALSFGNVDCNKTAMPQQVTFSNVGTQSYTITKLELGRDPDDGGSPFLVSMTPDSGIVGTDGGAVVITVTPRKIPAISAVTPGLYSDTLTVTTDVAGDPKHTIPLDESSRGAIFGLSASSFNFGSVNVGGTGTAQFSITNSGNATGVISLTPGAPMVFGLPQSLSVNANTGLTQIASFMPTAPAMYSDSAIVSVASMTVLCQPLPLTMIPLSGQGTNGSVVSVAPQNLTFGLVRCGQKGPNRTVDVINNSSQTLGFTLTFGQGSALYTATGADGGTPVSMLAPSAMATIVVVPKPIPASASTVTDSFFDTLSIRGQGGVVDETHVVGLHQTAEGAVLSFNPTALNFNNSGSLPFSVVNQGNLAATYTLTESGQHFQVTPTGATVAALGSNQHTATYGQPGLNLFPPYSASVSLSTAATLCKPVPADLSLTGH